MANEIRKAFEKWWEIYKKGREGMWLPDSEKIVKDAFEQGWTEGVASMVDFKMSQAMPTASRMGDILKKRKEEVE